MSGNFVNSYGEDENRDKFGAIKPEYIDKLIKEHETGVLTYPEVSYLIDYIKELRERIAILKDNDE